MLAWLVKYRHGTITLPVAPRTVARRAAATARGAARLLPAAAFALVIGLWAVPHLMALLADLRAFDPVLGDGPYQMFNPLRRIAAGQRGGVEFHYFHGIGVPYLHYPIFAAAGQDVFASELSRRLVGFALYLVGYLFVFAALTRRATPTLGLTAAALVLGDQIPLHFLYTPFNSTSGVRSAVPFLLLGVLLADLRPLREALILGAGAAVALLLGTESGVATVFTLGLVWLGRRRLGHPGGRPLPLVVGVAAFAATLAGLLLAIGGRTGAVAVLRYALVDLPADQFWFFGAPPQKFLGSVWELPKHRELWATALGPAAAVAAVVLGWASRDRAARPTGLVLLAALADGLLGGVGYLGYVSIHYFQPLGRLALTVGLVLAWHAWVWAANRPAVAPVSRGLRLGFGVVTGVAVVAGPTPLVPSSIVDVRGTASHLVETVAVVRESHTRLGPTASRYVAEVTAAIDADRAARGAARPPVIWSTYAGQVEAHYGVFHPHTDYAIHAIGPTGREAYHAAFQRANPDYVVTFRRDTFEYEEWLENANWGFFEEVLLNYEPLAAAQYAVVWRRTADPWRTPTTADRVSRDPDGPDHFTLDVPSGGPVVVEVEYEVRNALRRVPVVGGLPRYLLVPSGCGNKTPVSLPPYRTSWTFPVFPTAGQTPTFYAGTVGPVGGRVVVTKVHVRPLRVDGREQFLLNPALIPNR